MSDNTTPTVGKLLNGTEGRDAIHFALAPVRAAYFLHPGEHVGIDFRDDGCYWVKESSSPVGIVDPFLAKPVITGEWCWLFLYPGTITGLRHVWKHPAFQAGAKSLGLIASKCLGCGASINPQPPPPRCVGDCYCAACLAKDLERQLEIR